GGGPCLRRWETTPRGRSSSRGGPPWWPTGGRDSMSRESLRSTIHVSASAHPNQVRRGRDAASWISAAATHISAMPIVRRRPAMASLAKFAVVFCAILAGAATAIAAKSTIQVFALPEGTHPHDVAPAPDGTIWYTAQASSALGILDPQTGKSRQVPLGDGSAPHGVIAGPDGAAWITDGGLNAIVRFDPVTQKLTKFPLPAEAEDANLNTAAFDGKGRLWFTGQGGFYGRLDPGTGAMRIFQAPPGP